VNDQHITAIATIVQDVLLFLSAFLIAWYLLETRKMRKAAEDQVARTQDLVAAAQRQLDTGHEQVRASQSQATAAYEQLAAAREQIALAQDELEGQIRPALLARMNRLGVELVNIGVGPALHVKLGAIPKNSMDRAKVDALQQDLIGFIEPKQTQQTIIRVFAESGMPPQAPLIGSRNLWCEYQSLSGRTHVTVVAFVGNEGVEGTHFYQLPS
jgi:hypothetical protein